mgnify:FL=1
MMSGLPVPSSRTKDGAIYLDNAATSWPKPPGVAAAIVQFLEQSAANPGRSGHRMSVEAARMVYQAREEIASLFGAPDPLRVIFGQNITDAINLVLHGFLHPGDHVVTSSMEHNAVMRPLRALESKGVSVTCVPCSPDGRLDPQQIEDAIQPKTRLIVLTHASNVCGTMLPIRLAGEIAHRHQIYLLVDAAQTAGVFPIHMEQDSIDFLAFTGHKSLYGPTGTGGLVLGTRVDHELLAPIRQGGTGSRSEHETQPGFLPDRYESGTPNSVGLAGLLAAIRWISSMGVEAIRSHEVNLCNRLLVGLAEIPGITIYGTQSASQQTATIGFNIRGVSPSTAALQLDEEFGILCRVGLHCAPAAHHTIGTFPEGCIRFGLGVFNTMDDIDQALFAIRQIAREVQ